MDVNLNSRNSADSPEHTILIVDDDAASLGMLFDCLESHGFKVLVSQDGESGLERTRFAHPDLILLDILMPDMDGLEVCRRLKANPATSDIPVMFLTVLTNTEDKIKGFEAGAVDYITKPLQHEEVLARVNTHLRLQDLTRQLQEANRELEKRADHLERQSMRLQVAARVARDATAAYRLEELLHRAVDLIQDRFGFYSTSIFLIDEPAEYAILKAASGPTGRKLLEEGLKLKVGGPGIVGHVSDSGKPCIKPDVRSDPIHLEHPLLPETRSEMALPLQVGERVIGVLDVQSRVEAAFDEGDIQVLQTLADQLAVAYERMRLFEQTQAALEQRLEVVISSAPVILLALDQKGVFTLAKGKGLEATGFDVGRFVGQSAFDLFQHMPQVTEDVRRALGGEAFASTMNIAGLVFETWWSPLRDPGGDLTGTTAVATDITEIEQAQKALRESEARYRELFQQTQAALTETQALYRVSRSLINSENLPDLLQAVADGVAEALPANRVTLINFDLEKKEMVHFVKGGPGTNNVVHVSYDELWEGLCGWVLRERKPALSPGGIPDPRESPAVQRRRDDTNCGAIISVPLCYRDKTVGTLTAINRPQQRDFTQRDVGLMTAMANQAAIAIENARLYQAAQQEIAERKLAEEALREARDELEMRVRERTAELKAANQELERFAYTVSHDLKSPLITVEGFLHFLEQDTLAGNTEQMQTDLFRIKSAIAKMQQLLDEILELSRIGRLANPPEEVALVELAREAVESISGRIEERGVEVTILPNLPVVRGDGPRLRQVLENLVDNAVKYIGDQPDPRIEIGARYDDGETIFYVRDNGMGIDPRYQERVFGLFERLDQSTEGTGVGLAIVKRIVEVHGGRIWVESEGLGQGSTFCFTLAQPEASSVGTFPTPQVSE